MAAAYPTTPGYMYPPPAMLIDPQSLPYAYAYPNDYVPDAYGNLPRIEDSSQAVTDLNPESVSHPHHHHHHHYQHPQSQPHPHLHHHHHHHHQHPHSRHQIRRPEQDEEEPNQYHRSSRTPSDRSESPDSAAQAPVRLAIRRHSPGALDPIAQEASRKQVEPMILPRSPVVSSPYQPVSNPQTSPRSILRRRPSQKSESSSDGSIPAPSPFLQQRPRTPPSSRDPDERPIRPMKDTTVYRTPPASTKRPVQKKKPISPPKPPVQSSPKPPVQSPPVSPRRYEPEPKPISQSRPRTNNNTNNIPRRPVRIDVIPRRVSPMRSEIQSQPRQVVVEEYEDEDEDGYSPNVRVMPEKVIEYRVISHDSPRVRRVIQTQEMPRRRIIYRQ